MCSRKTLVFVGFCNRIHSGVGLLQLVHLLLDLGLQVLELGAEVGKRASEPKQPRFNEFAAKNDIKLNCFNLISKTLCGQDAGPARFDDVGDAVSQSVNELLNKPVFAISM